MSKVCTEERQLSVKIEDCVCSCCRHEREPFQNSNYTKQKDSIINIETWYSHKLVFLKPNFQFLKDYGTAE